MTRQLKIQQPFNLELTLTMGQAFRWRELPPDFYDDGHKWFSGVLGANLYHIRQTGDGIEYRVGGSDEERKATPDDDETLRRYFREDDDVITIYADISRDPKMATIMEEHPGLRLLRQDPWECLISYICSANTGVTGIANKVEAITDLGKPVRLATEIRHTFPTPSDLAAAGEPYLRELSVGKPATYATTAAHMILSGESDPYAFASVSYRDAKQRLMDYPGIGNKIADCICLFALDKQEAFPVDRWVWRAITEVYPEWGFEEKPQPTQTEIRRVSNKAGQVFGEHAGYANQYLFYWRRKYGEEPLSFAYRWHGKLRLPPGMTVDDVRYEYMSRKYLS